MVDRRRYFRAHSVLMFIWFVQAVLAMVVGMAFLPVKPAGRLTYLGIIPGFPYTISILLIGGGVFGVIGLISRRALNRFSAFGFSLAGIGFGMFSIALIWTWEHQQAHTGVFAYLLLAMLYSALAYYMWDGRHDGSEPR